MALNRAAQRLGRLGGLARARSLTSTRRRDIAAMGGRSSALARFAAERVATNVRWLAVVKTLRRAGREAGLGL
jgi:hypothetical protein